MVWATTILVVAYMALILFFVVRGALRTRSIADYATGSMAFSPVVVGLSLAAGITSAATFVINPGFIALYGWSAFVGYGLATPLGLYLSLIFLSKSYRRYGSTVKAATMAQWMANRFDSRGYGLFFAILSLLLLTFVVLICVGMTKVLAPALNANETSVLAGIVVFVFGYMMFGGANSMVYTNTIQAVLMLIVAFVLLGSGYEHFSGGVQGLIARLDAIDPSLTGFPAPKSPLFRDFFEIVVCNFVVGVAVVCQPHIITRSLLLKNDRDVNRYLLVGILAEMIFFMVVFTGFYARIAFPDLTANGVALKMDGIIPAYVVAEFPVFVGLLVILGLLSAGLSTLEGLIQSLSTTITADIVGRVVPDERRLVWINKLVIVGLAVAAFYLSVQQLLHPGLTVGVFAQNGVYAYFSAAFMPVLLGIYGKNVPTIAPVAASLVAVATHFAVYYGGLTFYTQGAVPNPGVAATLAIFASVLTGLGLYSIFKKSST